MGPCISVSLHCPDTVVAMLAWMDLAMTGLDPSQHVIVEIATLITDDELNLIAEGPDLVVHATDDELSAMDDFVTNMHTKSGLLDQIKTSTVPLCGNSIGTDRRFLDIYLPEIEEFLHYRSVDVSTIKELARRWYPDALAAVPRKEGGHRALDDIRESLKELAYWRGAVFADAPDEATN